MCTVKAISFEMDVSIFVRIGSIYESQGIRDRHVVTDVDVCVCFRALAMWTPGVNIANSAF